jgi:trehalose 6-phosphate synthase/phosphatase
MNHIDDYCLNFVDCCQRRLGCRVDRLPAGWTVEFDGRSVQIRALPIGIPFQRFVCMAQAAPKVNFR